MKDRLQSIDLLRGLAIILVIFCHSPLGFAVFHMGWTGVDLFFVLSGFLVSGLLFSEYKKYGTIQPWRFLIRRGFKIYPLFWTMLLALLTIDLLMIHVFSKYTHSFSWCGSCYIHELLFIQNYLPGRGFITWSLAIEEHFYILAAFFIWLLAKLNKLDHRRSFTGYCIAVLLTCNLLRIWTVNNIPYSPYTTNFPTHLRADSLVFGTMIAYLYHFSHDRFIAVVQKNKIMLFLVSLVSLGIATYLSRNGINAYLYTIGYTLLYITFGTWLSLLVTTPDIETRLQKWLTKPVLKVFTFTGYYSYSIYLFHIIVANIFMPLLKRFVIFPSVYLEFVVYAVVSVGSAVLISKVIEIPFLKLRDRLYPKRTDTLV